MLLGFVDQAQNVTSPGVRQILVVALLLQLAAIGYFAVYFFDEGYLPAPFVYNKFDTFMDVYNSLWWNREAKYTLWQSVYPPLNFLILDIIDLVSFRDMSFEYPADMRDEFITPAVIITITFLLAPIATVCSSSWSAFEPKIRALVAAIACASPLTLFSIERANLICYAFLCLPFAFSSHVLTQTITIAVLINLKPYFALLLLPLLTTRRWYDLIITVIFAGVIFTFTGLACDADFLHFLPNLFAFSQSDDVLFSGRELLSFPGSVSAFTNVINIAIKTSSNPSLNIDLLVFVTRIIEVTKIVALVGMVAALIIAGNTIRISVGLACGIVLINNLGVWVGGYSQLFYLACVPAFYAMRWRKLYLGIVLLIWLPLDVPSLYTDNIGPFASYFSWSIPSIDWQLSLGVFVRPVLNFLLLIALTAELVLATPAHAFIPRKTVNA